MTTRSRYELAAAEFLRDRGWAVSKPVCPECNGWGVVTSPIWMDEWDGFVPGSQPCPRGCPRPMWVL